MPFSFNYPIILNSYGPNLANIASHEALNHGFCFYDSITIAPNKKIEDVDIPKGELLIAFNEGNSIGELYLNENGYVLLQKSYSLLSNDTSENDDDDSLDIGAEPLDIPVDQTDALNPVKEEFKITSVGFYHKTQEEALVYKTRLLLALREVEVDNKNTRVTFWYQTSRGPTNYHMSIETPTWDDIKDNYNMVLRSNLDQLINYNLESNNGSIILLHGPAGTGKTFFIRSLIHAWKKTSQINYVIDSDNLFDKQSAEYLVQMMCLPKATGKYSIIIMEDSGEMIAKDAKMMMGQAMSRMLNLSDGILGQGGKNILLISTNEELKDLNEAASRPGRCFAKLKFDEFPQAEASSWLNSKGIIGHYIDGAKSLAELYEILNSKQITNKSHNRIGF